MSSEQMREQSARLREIKRRMQVLDRGMVAAYEIIEQIRAEKAELESERTSRKVST